MCIRDSPYAALQKNKRAYEIMLLRDQHHATFAQIAEKYGVSLVRAQQIYRKTKIMQIHLYLNHLAATLKQSDCLQMQKVYDKAYKSYQDWVCVCAYLEKRYRRILESYRAGEPGMPAAILKALPPLRPHLTSQEVKRIVKMCIRDSVITVSGASKKEFVDQRISQAYEQAMENRRVLSSGDADPIPPFAGAPMSATVLAPILAPVSYTHLDVYKRQL